MTAFFIMNTDNIFTLLFSFITGLLVVVGWLYRTKQAEFERQQRAQWDRIDDLQHRLTKLETINEIKREHELDELINTN